MVERIEEIRKEAAEAIGDASTTAELEELRVRYLGRKADLTEVGLPAQVPNPELLELGGRRRIADRLSGLLPDLLDSLNHDLLQGRTLSGAERSPPPRSVTRRSHARGS